MYNLKGFFHFLDGTMRQRAIKITGSIFIAVLLVTTATAIDAAGAVDSATETLHFRDDVCTSVITERSAIIKWETTVPTDDNYVMYGHDSSFGHIARAESGTTHTAKLDNLKRGAELHYRVLSRRRQTSETIQSGTCTIRIGGIDKTAPKFTKRIHKTKTSTTAKIGLQTNEQTKLIISVLAKKNGGIVSAPEAVITTSSSAQVAHLFSLTNLKPNTSYVVRIDAIDNAGNSSTLTPPVTFRTLHK